MKRSFLIVVICLFEAILFSNNINAGNDFNLISEATQKNIVKDLSNAFNNLAQASIPIGADTETEWAASEEQYYFVAEQIREYALYFDKISEGIFKSIFSEPSTAIQMTDSEFEEFMLESTRIKVSMMNTLTEEFKSLEK